MPATRRGCGQEAWQPHSPGNGRGAPANSQNLIPEQMINVRHRQSKPRQQRLEDRGHRNAQRHPGRHFIQTLRKGEFMKRGLEKIRRILPES
jgi:hypothetical protein